MMELRNWEVFIAGPRGQRKLGGHVYNSEEFDDGTQILTSTVRQGEIEEGEIIQFYNLKHCKLGRPKKGYQYVEKSTQE